MDLSAVVLFDKNRVIHELQHILPTQEPLVNFIHHNTLHALQDLPFNQALSQAMQVYGYKVYLPLTKFRELYQQGLISPQIINTILVKEKGQEALAVWQDKLLHQDYPLYNQARIGVLRQQWKKHYQIDLDLHVYPLLFKILCNYVDQGIALWGFPLKGVSFLAAMRELEQHSLVSIFKTRRVRKIFTAAELSLENLLKILLGDNPALYEQYLFDQQLGHKGWSGMIATIERTPKTLLDPRQITLEELIYFELLLEIDTLEHVLRARWQPLVQIMDADLPSLHAPLAQSELFEVLALWQKAFEWSYYDPVLSAIQQEKLIKPSAGAKSFQGLFCLDDRECSLRRYLENLDPACETFGLPGFFNVPIWYQASGSKFYSKLAPAPLTPKHLIQEHGKVKRPPKPVYFSRHSHNFIIGWFVSQIMGFWFSLKLLLNLLRPSSKLAHDTSLHSAHRPGKLNVSNTGLRDEQGLQIGFTVAEMSAAVEQLLRNIALSANFAELVYVVGHGASSVNNPHYAAYDCGACSGRAGTANARVLAQMANHPHVRQELQLCGIIIPPETLFIAALHDTTRDEIIFYDLENLAENKRTLHQQKIKLFQHALDLNAKERSRRFASINSLQSAQKIHQQIIQRSLSIFEPRPELNHATNALCIIGSRALSKGVFLDRRSFLQSFNYLTDPSGEILANILQAAVPVCGGINLEYYFSKVDQNNLGAGTKLPYNVMGLVGVANGSDGDLRTGLPSQMIEIHDPLRIMFIIEHFPEIVLNSIRKNTSIYEWFINSWVNLTVIHPESRQIYVFASGKFEIYTPQTSNIPHLADIDKLLAENQDNLPVCLL